MNRRRLLVPAMVVLGVLSGCSDPGYQGPKVATMLTGGRQAPSTAPMSDEDRMRAFESCLKDKGVDMQRGPDSGPPSEELMAEMEKAYEACRDLLPNGGAPPPVDAKQLDEARKQAQCLRDRGLDVRDPTQEQPYPGGMENLNLDSEQARKALEECMGMPKAIEAEPTR